MQKLIFSFLLFLFFNITVSFGQWSFSAGPGMAIYAGDVAKVLGKPGIAMNFEIWYEINKKFTLKTGSSIYKISATDYSDDRKRSFRSKNIESYIQLMYSYKKPHHNYYHGRASLTPFIYAGLGVTKVDPEGKRGDSNNYTNLPRIKPEGKEIEQFALIIPIGGGLKYAISKHFAIVGDFGLRFTPSDLLDGVSKSSADIEQSNLSSAALSYYSSLTASGDAIGGNSSVPDIYAIASVKIQYIPMPSNQSKFRKKSPYAKYSRFTSRHRK